tara:strand:- start:823 stop:1209 length:387 start_codon:yes stop_codon:yes gene_type:complete
MSKPFKMKAARFGNSPMQKNFPTDISAKPGDTPLEAWDWGSAGKGAASGAAAGAAFGPWGAAIGGAVGGVWSGIKGGKAKEEQEALLEAQQLEEDKKNKLAAEALATKKRERGNYSGFTDPALETTPS